MHHDAERWTTLSLVGNLADLGLGDIFQIVSLSRRSGTLQLTTPVESGEIVFRAGKVVAAYRSNAPNSIGEGLLETGVLAPTSYQDMLAAQRGGKRGPELFNIPSINQEALQSTLENVLKQVIYAMFEWNEGTFSFVLEDSPDIWRGFALEGARAVAENGLNPQYLAIEGARLRDERVKEDTLSNFLQKAQPPPANRNANAGLNVQEIAAKLRNAAELDAQPAAATSAVASPAPVPEKAFAVAAAPAPSSAVVSSPVPVNPAPIVASPRSSPSVVASSSHYRLLAVDDDPQVTKYIQNAFAGRFAQVAAVDNVNEALIEIESDPNDLVVAADLIIARSDGKGILGGIEILEKVRQRWPELPVVLFTDYQNEEAETRARNMGALATLQKPRKAQVQAAAKQGGGGVVQEFLTGLERALSAFLNGPAAPGARVSSAAALSAAPNEPIVAPPTAFSAVPSESVVAPPIPAVSAAEAAEASSREISFSSLADGGEAAIVPPEPARVGIPTFDLGSAIGVEMDALGRSLEAELPPPLLSAGDMAVLRSMLAELVDPSNRETVTLLVLRFASHLVERAGLFLATRRVFVGLGGFCVDEASDQFVGRVRRVQIPVEIDSVFARVCHFRSMIRAPLKDCDGNRRLIEGLGGGWPTSEAVAAPLISGDRVAAILFGDNPSGKALGLTDSLEIFLQQAGLAMDRALLERKLEDSRKQRRSAE